MFSKFVSKPLNLFEEILCLKRSFHNSYTQNIKIKHFSHPFCWKFSETIPHFPFLLKQFALPTTSLQPVLSRLPIILSWLNKLSLHHYHFPQSLSHIWHSGPLHPSWNTFFSWFQFSFAFYINFLNTMYVDELWIHFSLNFSCEVHNANSNLHLQNQTWFPPAHLLQISLLSHCCPSWHHHSLSYSVANSSANPANFISKICLEFDYFLPPIFTSS